MRSIELKYCGFKNEAVFVETEDVYKEGDPKPVGLRRTCMNKDKACEALKDPCEIEN